MTAKENTLSATLAILRGQLEGKQLVITQHEAWQRKALEALGVAVVAMGRAGANHDTQHAQRAAWEQCRLAIGAAVGMQPPEVPHVAEPSKRYPLTVLFFRRYEFGRFNRVPGSELYISARETPNYYFIPGATPGTERQFRKSDGAAVGKPERETEWAYVELQGKGGATIDNT